MNPFKYGQIVRGNDFCRRPELEKNLANLIKNPGPEGPACNTVIGKYLPSGENRPVIPSFFPINPLHMAISVSYATVLSQHPPREKDPASLGHQRSAEWAQLYPKSVCGS